MISDYEGGEWAEGSPEQNRFGAHLKYVEAFKQRKGFFFRRTSTYLCIQLPERFHDLDTLTRALNDPRINITALTQKSNQVIIKGKFDEDRFLNSKYQLTLEYNIYDRTQYLTLKATVADQEHPPPQNPIEPLRAAIAEYVRAYEKHIQADETLPDQERQGE